MSPATPVEPYLALLAPVAVAGGVRPETLPELLVSEPEVVVVGQYIVDSADPGATAEAVRTVQLVLDENRAVPRQADPIAVAWLVRHLYRADRVFAAG